ncbi:MAG: hypothetical protein KBA51_00285 [Kiritimatiellae bacterium]|nr:hypothetical protein [Kiritimatiellia bacterium]
MSKPPMTRQQKQLALLGALAALGVIVLIYIFLWTPWMAARAEKSRTHRELISTIQKARQLQAQAPEMKRRSLELRSDLRLQLNQMIAPADNALLWANGVLDAAIRSRGGLTLDTVGELTMARPTWVRAPESKSVAEKAAAPAADSLAKSKTVAPPRPKRFGPYRISCSVVGDFRDIVELAQDLQNANPYLSIIRIDVANAGPSGDAQRAQVIIEWPRHSGNLDSNLAEFLLTEETEDSSKP